MDIRVEERKSPRRAIRRRVKSKYGDYGKIFECEECGKTFSTGAGLDIHMRSHAKHALGESSFQSKETLVKQKHDSNAEEACDELLNSSDNVLDPDYGNDGSHRKTCSREDQRKVCEICNMSLANASSLKTHMRRHTGERPYFCTLCDKRFTQLNGLTVHMHTHSNERFPCKECGLVFTQLRSLKKHTKYHTGELELKRPIHGPLAEFKLRVPKGGEGGYETVYRCNFCDKDFRSGSQLVVHRRIHTNERPFECKVCQRRFKQKVTLQDHEKTHLSEKPYKCEKCGTCFKQLRILRQHMRLPICEKKMIKNYEDLHRKVTVEEEEQMHNIVESFDKLKDTMANYSSHTESKLMKTDKVKEDTDEKLLLSSEPQQPFPTANEQGTQEINDLEMGAETEIIEMEVLSDHGVNKLEYIPVSDGTGTGADQGKVAESFLCDLCGKLFRRKQNLLQHRKRHTGERAFAGGVGCKEFKMKSTLVEHPNIHTEGKPHSCELCGKVFQGKKNLIQHRKIHTDERPFACGVCCKEFKTRSTLIEHLNIHTEGKPHSCQTCGRSFKTRKCLQNHIGRNICTRVHPYACENCDKVFMYERYLQNHKCGGTPPKVFECEECDRKFTRHNLFIEHKRTHTGERPLECEECGKRFAKRDLLRRHRLTHKERKFMCDECGIGFVQKSTLQNHMAVHSEDRKHVCKVCSRAFKTSSSLRNHLKAMHCDKTKVEETKPSFYLCTQCGKAFKHLRWMLKHFCTASGIKRFPCPTCGKQFKKKQQLEVHSRIHTGARPYACDQCERTFTQSNSLKDHMVTHTREKKHKCDHCDSVFTRKNSLQRHMLIIHQGVEPFICNKCGLTFKYKKSYDAHVRVCEEMPKPDDSVQIETEIAERTLTVDDDKAMIAPDLEQQVLDNILGNIERAMNGAGIEIRPDVQYQIIVGENANEVTVQLSGDTQ